MITQDSQKTHRPLYQKSSKDGREREKINTSPHKTKEADKAEDNESRRSHMAVPRVELSGGAEDGTHLHRL